MSTAFWVFILALPVKSEEQVIIPFLSIIVCLSGRWLVLRSCPSHSSFVPVASQNAVTNCAMPRIPRKSYGFHRTIEMYLTTESYLIFAYYKVVPNYFFSPELRSCVKVDVAVLGSPSLIVLMGSVDVKQH